MDFTLFENIPFYSQEIKEKKDSSCKGKIPSLANNVPLPTYSEELVTIDDSSRPQGSRI